MLSKQGLLITKSYAFSEFNRVASCDRSLMLKYKGFDGEFWPNFVTNEFAIIDGLASIASFQNILGYFNSIDKHMSKLLFVRVNETQKKTPAIIEDKFAFLGYDYGCLDSEYNHYSVVFNEIICGFNDKMKSYLKLLNEDLLFKSLDDLAKLSEGRAKLLREGVDLETDNEFVPISIYLYKTD